MKNKMSYLTFYALTRILLGLLLTNLFIVKTSSNYLKHYILCGIIAILLILLLILGKKKPDELDKDKLLKSKNASANCAVFAGVLFGLGKFIPFLNTFYEKIELNIYQNIAVFFIVLLLVSDGIFVLIEEKVFQLKYKKDDDFSKEQEGNE